MNHTYRTVFSRLAAGLVVAVPSFAIGAYALLRIGGVPGLLGSLPFLVIGALAVAPPLCELCAIPLSSMFWPSTHYARPQPMYSVPLAKRQRGDLEGAMAAYRAIAAEYPEEIQPYLCMLSIAINDMRNRFLCSHQGCHGTTLRA
jgi:hypothetical protein